ncbi:MAG TPA: hypothetical protein VH089_27305 [Streptosporangiaceae bacterium]|nr:hypothetical protein [Streptosporangiaceae bacterium]
MACTGSSKTSRTRSADPDLAAGRRVVRDGGHSAGLAAAFGDTCWWATGLTVAGALPALLLRRPQRSRP